MRQPSVSLIVSLSLLLGMPKGVLSQSTGAKSVKIQLNVGSVDLSSPNSIQIFYDDLAGKDQVSISQAVGRPRAWAIFVDGNLSLVQVQNAVVEHPGLIILTLNSALDASTVSKHHTSVQFAGDPALGVPPESVDIKEPRRIPHGQWFLPQINFTTDKTKANLDISGTFEAGVGAKPLYQWNVQARYPVSYNGSNFVFKAGPQFSGVASQETNADPDSMTASAATEFDFPYHKIFKDASVNLSFNPINYEFERKAKQEAVLVNGKPTVHDYQQKNSNVVLSGQIQLVVTPARHSKFVPRGCGMNANLNGGTEVGSAVSRSVLNESPKPGYSDNPLRAVAGADLYFSLPTRRSYHILDIDGHYTVRSLFHPEPFKEAGVNNGNEFYTTKARHYVAVNFARTLAKGANVTVQYKYGSLPPTFSFVDHQVTIGFEVVLGKP